MRKLMVIAASLLMSGSALAQTASVAVTAIVEHPSLNAVREGVRDGLEKGGYKIGDNLKFTYESAQSNAATAAQIARDFVGNAPDVIVPIATPVAQAVAAATRTIPVVFSAVTDPVAAGLVTDLEKPGGNITGVSDLTPVNDHIALIKEIVPNVVKVGFVYNPGEANSVASLDQFREAATVQGLTVVEAVVNRTADVQAAARGLVGAVEAIYVPTDNTVVSAFEAIVGVANEHDLPLISADTDSVSRGALAAVGFDYYEVGLLTADIVLRILKGEKPGDIPVGFATGSNLVLNKTAAKDQGVTLSDDLLKRASNIIE